MVRKVNAKLVLRLREEGFSGRQIAAQGTYCRTWAGFSYTAFVVDVFADRIVSWHVQTTKHTELVTIPLRMAL